jgi:hypothetical protein
MFRLLLAAALVIILPSFVLAAPCTPNSMSNYISLGAGGCQIGSSTFFSFEGFPSFSGGTSVSPTLVLVTPTDSAIGPRLDFSLSGNAGSNTLLGIAIGYSIAGSPLSGAALTLTNAAATGNGVVTVVEDICRGGTFASDPSNCSTPAPASLVVAHDSSGPTGPDSRIFAANSFFDVFVDIAIDGGPSGTATLGTPGSPAGTVSNQFTRAAVPEPESITLVGTGVLALWAMRRRIRL